MSQQLSPLFQLNRVFLTTIIVHIVFYATVKTSTGNGQPPAHASSMKQTPTHWACPQWAVFAVTDASGTYRAHVPV